MCYNLTHNTMNDSEIKNVICSLYYNLTSNCVAIEKLEILLNEFKNENIHNDSQRCYLFVITVKLIIYCRDIMFGKGQRQLSYSLLHCLHKYYPEVALFIIKQLPQYILQKYKKISVGCWRDIPEFCKYVRTNSVKRDDDPLIQELVHFMNEQLATDLINRKNKTSSMSLVTKWIPRERCKTSWLYNKFAMDWFKTIDPYKLSSAKTPEKYVKAVNNCKKIYRQIVSVLNSNLETVEIFQCSHQWSRIDPQNTNIHSVNKYIRSLLHSTNSSNNSDELTISADVSANSIPLTDRSYCHKKFYEHYDMFLKDKFVNKKIFQQDETVNTSCEQSLYQKNVSYSCKQNTVSIQSFVKRALSLIQQRNKIDDETVYMDKTIVIQKKKLLEMKINVLNKEWKYFGDDISSENCIPIVCMDYYKNNGHLGIACLYAKNTKRVIMIKNGNSMFCSDFVERTTVNISDLDSFVDIIERLHRYCEITVNNKIDVFTDMSAFFYDLHNNENIKNNDFTRNKFIFISNINILTDIKIYANYRETTNGIFIFHYLGTKEIVYSSNLKNDILIATSDDKATIKHITNYSFSTNFNMINHCLNVYSSSFFNNTE